MHLITYKVDFNYVILLLGGLLFWLNILYSLISYVHVLWFFCPKIACLCRVMKIPSNLSFCRNIPSKSMGFLWSSFLSFTYPMCCFLYPWVEQSLYEIALFCKVPVFSEGLISLFWKIMQFCYNIHRYRVGWDACLNSPVPNF